MTILRFDDYLVMPWKNGLGVTREIARFPAEGEFEWRLSMATVGEWAEFSTFRGVTRALAVVVGGPLRLVVEGVEQLLERGGPAATFSGEVPAGAAGIAVTDLNMMTRGGWTGSIEPVTSGRIAPGPGLTMVVALDTLDTHIIDDAIEFNGEGYLVRVTR